MGYTLIKTIDNKFFISFDTKKAENEIEAWVEVDEKKFNILVASTEAKVLEIPF